MDCPTVINFRLPMNTLRTIRSIACSAAALCTATLLYSAQSAPPDFTQLAATARSELQRNNVPGCAVAVVLGTNIVFADGFGTANLDTAQPVTADTLFRIGSTTKMFTAATLVSLAEQGKLKLDASISNYVKGLHPNYGRLTAHQLLTHTAGLADETKMEGSHDESALRAELRTRKNDLCFTDPGQIWSYSNPGYWLAGMVIEEVSGENYADAVRERVLKPLGMKRSTFRPTEAMTWPLAVGHGPAGEGKPSVIRPLADNAATWPAGQLFTTANEYARFCIAFLNGGRLDHQQALAPAVIEKLTTPFVAIPDSQRHYGYGLGIQEEAGLTWWNHSGSRTGYGSHIRMCPQRKFAVIVLCNKTGANLPRVTQKACQIAIGVPGPGPDRRSKPAQLTESELERYAGTYSNGQTRIRFRVQNGKLLGPLGTEIRNIGEHRFIRGESANGSDSTATEMLFVPGPAGDIQYLFRDGRALKKLPPSATN
jgi:CubicO group peptidase (beta-lactamase class C family)